MQASDWIKCSERMPELQHNEIVSDILLLQDKFGTYHIGILRMAPDLHLFYRVSGQNFSVDFMVRWMPIVGPEEE